VRGLELLWVRAGDRAVVDIEERLAAQPPLGDGALEGGLDLPRRGLGGLDQRTVFGLDLRDDGGDALPPVRIEPFEGAVDAN
jgi:hypothetical protein